MSVIQGLYAIIDPRFLPTGVSVGEYIQLLLSGGCRLVQLRCKDRAADIFDTARTILALKRDYDFTFIVNDDVACAKELRADGVHLGAHDGSIAAARALLGPHGLIGYSAHSFDEARAAECQGADYVAFGAIFPTTTKGPGHPVQGVCRLQQVVQGVNIPTVAIGGISREQMHKVVATGVAAVAMITGLSQARDPRAEVTWYIQQLARSTALQPAEGLW